MLQINFYRVFYWITVADGVKKAFDAFSNLFTTFAVIGLIIYVVNRIYRVTDECNNPKVTDQWGKHFSRFFYINLILCVITWFGFMLTPSKTDALTIVAGGAVGNFITSDSSAKQIPSELTNLLRLKIKDEIEQMKSPIITDTLESKSKDELIEMIKQKK
jgi:predicted PurR-regulated permease PerM